VRRDPVAKAFAGSNPAPRIGSANRRTAPISRRQLVRSLAELPAHPAPDPKNEQVATPPELAADLLFEAWERGDLKGRSLCDLGSGTGTLSLGAALLHAESVVGWECDPVSIGIARDMARRWSLSIDFRLGDVQHADTLADTVIMNPPFGAQRRGADREFWSTAFRIARSRIYAFASTASRSFIARRAVESGACIANLHRVEWELPTIFPHHRFPSRSLEVDLWVLEQRERS
jgi:putative methylase